MNDIFALHLVCEASVEGKLQFNSKFRKPQFLNCLLEIVLEIIIWAYLLKHTVDQYLLNKGNTSWICEFQY